MPYEEIDISTLISVVVQGYIVFGDLVYSIGKIVGKSNFSEQFRKLINRYKRIGYNPYIMRQTACLVMNPITVDDCASLFNCTAMVRPQTL